MMVHAPPIEWRARLRAQKSGTHKSWRRIVARMKFSAVSSRSDSTRLSRGSSRLIALRRLGIGIGFESENAAADLSQRVDARPASECGPEPRDARAPSIASRAAERSLNRG